MPPAVAALVLFVKAAADISSLVGSDLRVPELILIPVNDADDGQMANAGTHWTLLAFSRLDTGLHFFDSMGSGACARTAKILSARLTPLIVGGEP